MKKIAVLTSGGDAPSMNACLRAIAMMADHLGFEVFGVLDGYQGLIDGKYKKLTIEDVENILPLGGTIIRTSRCDEFRTEKGIQKAVKNTKKAGFDCVIVLGGDGSFHGAQELTKKGVNTICIPATVDNDLKYTDSTLGFSTAVDSIMDAVLKIRETCESHERVCFVEVMGRNSGELALAGGVASGAEVIIVPENKTNLTEIVAKINKSIIRGGKSVICIVAEGVGKAEDFAKLIKEKTGVDAKSVNLSYIQRGGSPTAYDRVLATKMGAEAVRLADSGNYNCAIGIKNGSIITVELEKVFASKRNKFDFELLKTNDILSV